MKPVARLLASSILSNRLNKEGFQFSSSRIKVIDFLRSFAILMVQDLPSANVLPQSGLKKPADVGRPDHQDDEAYSVGRDRHSN
jgi:hypothetical protein